MGDFVRMTKTCVILAALLSGCGTHYPAANPSVEQHAQDEIAGKLRVTSVVAPGFEDILSCASRRVDYIPIPPLPAYGYTKFKIDGIFAKLEPHDWPPAAAEVNALLTNIATEVADSEVAVKGNVGSVFNSDNSRKQYVFDFIKYRIEPLTTTENLTSPIGWARVGAGMRVIVDITQGDIELTGNLVALAASARLKNLHGFMSVELIGMDAKETTAAMPFTVDLTEGNVQKVIEALAVVKTKLYDTTTVLSPSFISKVVCSQSIPVKTNGDQK